jgi:hypothetical protein
VVVSGKNAGKTKVLPVVQHSSPMYRFLGYGFCIGLYGAALYYTAVLFGFKIGKDGVPEFKASEFREISRKCRA